MNTNTLCIILCREINNKLYNTYTENITDYPIIFITDTKPLLNKNNIIYYPTNECLNQGYKTMTDIKLCLAWDKAMKYLCKNNNYKYYWIIEDDVYVDNHINRIIKDNELIQTDLLYPNWFKEYINEKTMVKKWSHWKKGSIYFKNNNLKGCITMFSRLSNKLIKKINDFQIKYRRLLFHELLFPSLCSKYQLTYNKINNINSKYIKVHPFLNNLSKKQKIDYLMNNNIHVAHPIKKWYLYV